MILSSLYSQKNCDGLALSIKERCCTLYSMQQYYKKSKGKMIHDRKKYKFESKKMNVLEVLSSNSGKGWKYPFVLPQLNAELSIEYSHYC